MFVNLVPLFGTALFRLSQDLIWNSLLSLKSVLFGFGTLIKELLAMGWNPEM
jgi:hypothetical protein